jgi:4-hydroxybutyrate CoA-transferase
MDFVNALPRSRGGKSIIALPPSATLRDGTWVIRIVAMLKAGAGAAMSRNHPHYVATGNGLSRLEGKTLRQRSRALIEIPHPDSRDDLMRRAAYLRNSWPRV